MFDATRVSSGNSFCWETEVPLVLQGSYDPNFTAKMMHKDISLGLELAKRHGVPQPANELVRDQYEAAMTAYGEHVRARARSSNGPLAHRPPRTTSGNPSARVETYPSSAGRGGVRSHCNPSVGSIVSLPEARRSK